MGKMKSFWGRVHVGTEDVCWEWAGARNSGSHNYGYLTPGGRHVKAHRLSWEMAEGPIPDGLVVRHKCDNPPCVNPFHLELGTPRDNAYDTYERDRKPLKLSREQVADLRARYRAKHEKYDGWHWRSNADELAEEFGISRAYVIAVANYIERTVIV